ncbi:hypothetical protein VIBHAR_01512 [Vibrio campbellii ATCC BAA-1116]|uniref:Uncharacterized protein n=1 Tax=Vibrio campbellii (strain ATCC BAA-1116) TaxID=2902295 RepID=A7MZP0_VIBC1|nr:hypothetical protein VIBHAR_01512 [Vibrio campbellii ATCC BAA-1116]
MEKLFRCKQRIYKLEIIRVRNESTQKDQKEITSYAVQTKKPAPNQAGFHCIITQ